MRKAGGQRGGYCNCAEEGHGASKLGFHGMRAERKRKQHHHIAQGCSSLKNDLSIAVQSV